MKDEIYFQEIDFRRSFYKLISKKNAILITISIATIISFIGVILFNLDQDETAIYKGYTTIEVTPAEGRQDQLKVISEIIWSDTVFTRSRNNIGVDTQISEMKANTEIEEMLIGQDTSKTDFVIYYSNEDGDFAKEMSNLLAQQGRKLVVDTMDVNNIDVKETPQLSTNIEYVNNDINVPMITLLGFISGLFLSVIGVYIWYYFNETVIYPGDIEKKLNIKLLGNISKS